MSGAESFLIASLLKERSPRAATLLGVADQAASSLTNFGVIVLAARVLGVDSFGAFSIVYGIYVLIISAVQSYVGQALVLLQGSREQLEFESARALKFSIFLGLAVGFSLALLGLVVPSLGMPFVVLGVLMPLLLLQDTTRFCVSLLRAPAFALASDMLWIVLLVAGGAALLKVTEPSALVITLLWSVSGSISGLFSLILLSAWSRGSHLNVNEFVRSGYLGKRFLFEFAVIRGVGQILGISIGALVSISSAGAFRAAMTLFGPLNVLLNAVNAFAIPLLRQLSAARQERYLLALTVGFAALAAGGTAFLMAMPRPWGMVVFGESWLGTRELVVPFGVQAIGIAVSTVAFVAIRMISPTLTLRLRIIAASIQIIAFFTGIWLGGVQGAAWGITVASIAQALLAVLQYRQIRNLRDRSNKERDDE